MEIYKDAAALDNNIILLLRECKRIPACRRRIYSDYRPDKGQEGELLKSFKMILTQPP
jgi:hypothetical protein